jgi:hypothetical protein
MDTGRLKVKGMLDASASNSALILPQGGVLNRPSAPTGGMVRFNTDLRKIESWNGVAWIGLVGAGVSGPPIYGPITLLDNQAVAQTITDLSWSITGSQVFAVVRYKLVRGSNLSQGELTIVGDGNPVNTQITDVNTDLGTTGITWGTVISLDTLRLTYISTNTGTDATCYLIESEWQYGPTGTSGFSGFSGRSGYSGISGFSGVSGFSGFSGLSGATGPTGTVFSIQSNGSAQGNASTLNFATNLTATVAGEVATINASGGGGGFDGTQVISITNASSATSTTSGALRVVGGVGIGENLYVGGNLVTTSAGTPEIVSSTNLLLTATNRVSITSSPFKLASFTTTNRNLLTASNGDMIYNTTDNRFQGYQNGSWINIDDGTPG